MAGNTLVVKSLLKPTPDGGNPVAFWEEDPAHPKNAAGRHEVFVAGLEPVRVGRTGMVLQAIRDERLQEVGDGEAPAVAKGDEPAPVAARAPAKVTEEGVVTASRGGR